MTKQEQLSQWLGNRQRTYADGLTLFDSLAKNAVKEKFDKYLKQAPEQPHAFDPHFTQLINCLSRIDREIKEAPALYPAALEEVIVAKTMSETDRNKEIESRNTTIDALQAEVDELSERIESIESDNSDQSELYDTLQAQFDEKMKELATLRQEINALNTPGIKIVTEASLTPALRKAYDRIKEITPLYASLHNDIANPEIPAEERQPMAEELCKLDDERRKLWKQIDTWAEGKGNIELTEKRPNFSDNPVVRGIEIARHIKRLKQNITNSRIAAERAEKDGRKVVLNNALTRQAAYEAELKNLEAEISASSDTVTG